MKIIYLFTSPSLQGSSVQTKVLSQIKYLNKAGAECRGAFFSTEVKEITKLNEFADLIPVEKCTWKYFRKIGQKRNSNKSIYDYVKKNFTSTDLFYLRYPGASKGLYKIVKSFGCKIVSEHQSKEIDEIKSFNKENTFGLKPSQLLSWYVYSYLPIYNENKWGNLIAQNVKAIVTVTNEIAEYQANKGCKKVIVSTNGIDVSTFKVRILTNNNDKIKLLFLKGTSTIAEWNGINRIINAIDEHPNSENLKLIICGHHINGEIPIRNYIEHKGFLNKEELDGLFEEVHIGISTMALFKKNLNEAAVLKTREYISRGLPFIYAYTDPDLNEEAKEFSLQFPNDDSLFDIQQVINFAQKVIKDPSHPQKMRKYAEEHLDYKVKMERLYNELLQLQDES